LVVASKDAGLYPRQDDESEKIVQLARGETVTPMVQTAGGSEWYMVKTQKGLIGWVKASDVREEKVKK
jgi:NOL1/NOP2/fmu family ribosome biogenesis protein